MSLSPVHRLSNSLFIPGDLGKEKEKLSVVHTTTMDPDTAKVDIFVTVKGNAVNTGSGTFVTDNLREVAIEINKCIDQFPVYFYDKRNDEQRVFFDYFEQFSTDVQVLIDKRNQRIDDNGWITFIDILLKILTLGLFSYKESLKAPNLNKQAFLDFAAKTQSKIPEKYQDVGLQYFWAGTTHEQINPICWIDYFFSLKTEGMSARNMNEAQFVFSEISSTHAAKEITCELTPFSKDYSDFFKSYSVHTSENPWNEKRKLHVGDQNQMKKICEWLSLDISDNPSREIRALIVIGKPGEKAVHIALTQNKTDKKLIAYLPQGLLPDNKYLAGNPSHDKCHIFFEFPTNNLEALYSLLNTVGLSEKHPEAYFVPLDHKVKN